MTPEKLEELEKLEAAATPGGRWQASAKAGIITWGQGACLLHNGSGAGVPKIDLYLIAALRNNARDLFAALREAGRERDEARARLRLIEERHQDWGFIHDSLKADVLSLMKERDEARTALRMLWEEAESKCALRDSTEDAVKAVLGDD